MLYKTVRHEYKTVAGPCISLFLRVALKNDCLSYLSGSGVAGDPRNP